MSEYNMLVLMKYRQSASVNHANRIESGYALRTKPEYVEKSLREEIKGSAKGEFSISKMQTKDYSQGTQITTIYLVRNVQNVNLNTTSSSHP